MQVKDGDWTLVDYDPVTGRTMWRYFDGAATHFRTDYPVQSLVDDNAALLNASQGRRFGEGQRVASIPLNLFYDKLHEAHMQGDENYISRWLNDGDNRAFRTFEGTI